MTDATNILIHITVNRCLFSLYSAPPVILFKCIADYNDTLVNMFSVAALGLWIRG